MDHLAHQAHGPGGGVPVVPARLDGPAQHHLVEHQPDEEEVDDRGPRQQRLGDEEDGQHGQEGEQLPGELAERDEHPGDRRGHPDVGGAHQVGGVALQPLGPGGREGRLQQAGAKVLLEPGEPAGGPPLQGHREHRLGDDEHADHDQHGPELLGGGDLQPDDGHGQGRAGEHGGQHQRQQPDGRDVQGRQERLQAGEGDDEPPRPRGEHGQEVTHGAPQGQHVGSFPVRWQVAPA
ncbi:hypothetical protein [Ornithinimicrobium kibberense]|uniref:hypothetical protein n=1 Tax=Ornithinimicrobium kibberense TaxID=282060 RepID=UPI0036216512